MDRNRAAFRAASAWTRRRFVQGLGGSTLALAGDRGWAESLGGGTSTVLSGTEFDLEIGAREVNLTGKLRPATVVNDRARKQCCAYLKFIGIALLAPRLLWAQGYPDRHVAPAGPQNPMPAISYGEMARLMQMDDTEVTSMVLLDELEWRDTSAGAAAAWLGEGWYGGDYNKFWVRSEGEQGAETDTARIEAFWDRIVTRWWSVEAGARQDFTGGPERTWAALGLQGLAPYWFNVQATLYVGDSGRTAARLRTTYELLLTQRLILEPEIEGNLYGKSDPARHLGSGLSDLDAGLRLRYEFRREFAPYVGVAWQRFFGGTADQARALGNRVSEAQFTAGIRVWF